MSSEETAVDQQPASVPAKKGRLGPLLGVVVLLSALGGGGGFMYMQQRTTGDAAVETLPEPRYIQLRPAFVVNLADDDVLRFLQTEVDLMTRDESVPESVETHMPAVRHALVSILSAMRFSEMLTVEGKAQVQAEIQGAVNEILLDRAGSENAVEAVYFSSLVMQ